MPPDAYFLLPLDTGVLWGFAGARLVAGFADLAGALGGAFMGGLVPF